MPELTDIVIHLSGLENEAKVATTRYIRVKKEDGENTVERILVAIKALHSIVSEYENHQR